MFERFKGHSDVYIWHPLELKEETKYLAEKYDEWITIPGKSTTGLRCIPLGYELGYRSFELHGMDCSHDLSGDSNATRGNGHAYEKYTKEEHEKFKPEDDLGGELVRVRSHFGIRYFKCSKHMARQLGEFDDLLDEWDILVARGEKEQIEVKVAGEGALPYLAAVKYGIHTNPEYNKNPNLMPYIEPPGVKVLENELKQSQKAAVKGLFLDEQDMGPSITINPT